MLKVLGPAPDADSQLVNPRWNGFEPQPHCSCSSSTISPTFKRGKSCLKKMLWHIRKEKATASLKTLEISAAAAPAAVSSRADWHFHIKGRTKETGADGFYFTGTICFHVPPDWLWQERMPRHAGSGGVWLMSPLAPTGSSELQPPG